MLKRFARILGLSFLALNFILGGVLMAQSKADSPKNWDKTFKKSEAVDVKKVSFTNRFGIKIVGDLYTPKDIKKGQKLPAIAVSGPFGAVKEQSSGLYAHELAKRGFIALAFDPSFTGESGGAVRDVASADINTEDFSAAVDFLETYAAVDSNKIGILGICGWGGFALNVAALDSRIKATVASTMYDMARVNSFGYNDSMGAKERKELKKSLNAQRSADFKAKKYAHAGGVPETLPADAPLFMKQYHDYYKTPRGYHPRSLNSNAGWNVTSALSFINTRILNFADEIGGAVLVIHGEKAHSRYFSEDAFKKLKGKNKELLIVPGAYHVDLYDNLEKIPFGKIEQFYRENLK